MCSRCAACAAEFNILVKWKLKMRLARNQLRMNREYVLQQWVMSRWTRSSEEHWVDSLDNTLEMLEVTAAPCLPSCSIMT